MVAQDSGLRCCAYIRGVGENCRRRAGSRVKPFGLIERIIYWIVNRHQIDRNLCLNGVQAGIFWGKPVFKFVDMGAGRESHKSVILCKL